MQSDHSSVPDEHNGLYVVTDGSTSQIVMKKQNTISSTDEANAKIETTSQN